MTAKAERRDRKRRKREEGRRMRGDRSVFVILRQILKRNQYWKAGALDADELTPCNTDEPRGGGSFNLCKHGDRFPPYVRRK